jgi:hypothetical protein
MSADSSSTGVPGVATSPHFVVGARTSRSVDPDATHEISRELRSEESLLWAGRPFQGWRLHTIDVILVPFSVLWSIAALAAFVAGIEVLIGAPRGLTDPVNPEIVRWSGIAYAVIFVTAFPAFAFYLTCGRFMLNARRRARTWYGLTTERILIISEFFGRRVTEVPLHDLGHITFSHHEDGSGTICFDSRTSARPSRLRVPAISHCEFERVPQVRRLVRRITSAQRKI